MMRDLERRSEEAVVVLLQDAESPAELDQLLTVLTRITVITVMNYSNNSL